jgi:N-acetylmuramoyl-L-alanine amidase
VRSPKADDLYVLEKTDMTAILVEIGYISDSKDRQNLTRKDYQMLLADKLAEGIVAGLEELKSQKE